jgi:oligoendopeptidase F
MRALLLPWLSVALVVPVLVMVTVQALGQERPRSDVPDQYKWNLGDIYPSLEAWRAAKATVAADVPPLGNHAGKLGASAGALADALDDMFRVQKELVRVYVYASMLGDQDTRDAGPQAMRQEMVQLYAAFGAAVSYLEPEILRLPAGTVSRFVAAEPRLKPYAFYLQDIERRAAHTLSPAEERLLADAGPLAASPQNIFTILTNADFAYPTVRTADGRDVVLTPAAFQVVRASASREDRQKAMAAYFGALGAYSRTFGTTANGTVQKALFFARARKYDSSLAAALDGPNIPLTVYSRLIDGVNRHLPSFHRYLRLRKKMMGLDELHYYDLYAPLVSSVDLKYTPEEAQSHIIAALAPLGSDYTGVLKRAFSERWIDFFPNPGKRSGAYSNGGAYDVHPYMLLNYNGKYDDMSTLAHELGHTMHSYYSNKTQPYATADYATFVAEVASTFNESLLIDHILKSIKDDDTRLSILGNYLEGIKGTVFRQTQFAEFELRMHEMGQKGQAVTGDALAKLYIDITKKYYGHDQGVAVVDEYIAHEWSMIPHFYRDFYVFQYATSFTASEALAQKVKAGDAEATKRYLAFLGSGGSKYPVDLLKDAGVDMTTDEPLDLTMREMNRVMDQMEAILARRAGRP